MLTSGLQQMNGSYTLEYFVPDTNPDADYGSHIESNGAKPKLLNAFDDNTISHGLCRRLDELVKKNSNLFCTY